MSRLVPGCWWLLGLLIGLSTALIGRGAEPLPNTKPLEWEGDLAQRLLDGAHAFADRQTAASVAGRARHWKRDFASREAYERSVATNRARLAERLGVVDPRGTEGPEIVTPAGGDQAIKPANNWDMLTLRWSVVPGVPTSGVYLQPRGGVGDRFRIVLDDRALTSEQPGPVRPGLAPAAVVESGVHVVIPRLLDRGTRYSTTMNGARVTPLNHREYIYRQSFSAGRTPLGYDVQSVLALVDWIDRDFPQAQVEIVGTGEGGVIAQYAAALDPRVDRVTVRGYFGPRENLWQEPIDRNVWGLFVESGDAEVLSLIFPRDVELHVQGAWRYEQPEMRRSEPSPIAPGRLSLPTLDETRRELSRFESLVAAAPSDWQRPRLVVLDDASPSETHERLVPVERRLAELDEAGREVLAWSDYTQGLIRESEFTRQTYWSAADRKSRDPAKWSAGLGPYREYLADEVIGRVDLPLLPISPRSRQIYDEPGYVGYEVVLDVFPDVFAYGILLVPKGIPAGERRPVVVCQHGLEGRPPDTIESNAGERFYHRFAARLCERGYITFAPQNLYIFKDHFRQLQRKLYPLKLTLYSLMIPQHEQICRWLKTLPQADPDRIAFYGLSYGGKTAMRVPPLVEHYRAVICSGDFNEWIRKTTSIRDPFTYVHTQEYEIWEWKLANTFNYAELAGLICPRPFMVERGHRDGVGVDACVDYEFAKTRLLYVDLGLAERVEIEHFDGPHEIHAVGTFEFLDRHLRHTPTTRPERK